MYSVELKREITLEHLNNDWNAWIAFVNSDQRYCKTLHYLDYRNHDVDVTQLPSYHPYWSFQVYLGLRYLILNTLKTVRTYRNMLSDDLNLKSKYAIIMAAEKLEKSLVRYVTEARASQIKFTTGA